MGFRAFIAFVIWISMCVAAVAQEASPPPASESEPVTSDRPEDIQAFNTAYGELKQAVAEGRYSDAKNVGKIAFEKSKILKAVPDRNTAELALTLARLSVALYQNDEAFEWFDTSIEYFTIAYGEASQHHYGALLDAIGFSVQHNKNKEANAYLKVLDRVVASHYNRPCRERAVWHLYTGDVIRLNFRTKSPSVMNLKNLESHYRKAKIEFLAIEDFDGVGDAEFRLGKFELENEKEARAVRHFVAAIDAYGKAGTSGADQDFIRARIFLSVAYSRQGKEDLATEQLVLVGTQQQLTNLKGAQPVYRIDPKYPPNALSRGIEGWVHLEFTITTTGKIANLKILDSDPPEIFDNAAMKALEKWRYIPASKNGELVDFTHQVVLKFNVER